VSEPAEAVGAERHPQGDLPTWSLGEVLRMPKFWLIWTCPMGVMAGFAFYLAHGALHVQSLEYSLTTGAATLSTMLVFILIANGLLAVINGRITPRFVVAGGCGLFGIGLLLAINATGGPFLFPAMLGLGFGLALTTLNTMLVDYFGLKAYAVLVAIMLAGQTAAGAIADYTAGAVHDASGTYGGVFLTLGVLSCVGAAIWPFLAPNEPAATAQPVAATQKEET
jgi:MFS family permease